MNEKELNEYIEKYKGYIRTLHYRTLYTLKRELNHKRSDEVANAKYEAIENELARRLLVD